MSRVFEFLTDVRSVHEAAGGVDLRTREALVQLRVIDDGVFRVRVLPTPDAHVEDPFSYAIDPSYRPEPPRVCVHELEREVVVSAGQWRASVSRAPLRTHFASADGTAFARDSFGPGWSPGRLHVWKHAPGNSRYYGLGEKAYPLERSGRSFTNWNTDTPGYGAESDPLYKTFPFFVAIDRVSCDRVFAYGIFFDNAGRSYFDFGGQAQDHYSFGADGGELCYYVLAGPTPVDVLGRFTALTGRAPLPPRWTLGYQQCRWSYRNDAETRAVVREFRSRRLPLDALYLDIHHMHGYRVFSWNAHRFPDPRSLLRDLSSDGVRTIIIIDPGIKCDEDYDVAAEGLAGGHFVKYPDGSVYEGKVWPGACYFPDFTRPETRTWFGTYCRRALDQGVSAFWVDMNEPSNHSGRTLPDHVLHDMEGNGGTHLDAHNVYGLLMARTVFEAAESHRPDERPFVLSRSAYAGIQRYASLWTGDNVSSWEHLRMSVPMLLSLGMSGAPFVGTDVGGFFGTPSPELFVRWMQLGVFTPLFRNHSILDSPRQEPWAFGERAEKAARRALNLRYRFLPYLYTLFQQHLETGLPIMRPLVLHYPEDEAVANLDDAFLFGEHVLVAPVLRAGAEGRRVYLPEGFWYHLWTGRRYSGPTSIFCRARLDQIPVFVKAGTCLPLGPQLQHVDESPVEELELRLYAGDGASDLYEDDGRSRAHVRGDFTRHRFDLEWHNGDVTLRHTRTGNFEEGVRTFRIRVVGCGAAPRVSVDGAVQNPADGDAGVSQVGSDFRAITVQCGF